MPTQCPRGHFRDTRSEMFAAGWHDVLALGVGDVGVWGSLWTWCASERGLDLLQRLALCFWDEGDGEDDVGDAHGGEEPEGSSAGKKTLEEVAVI